MSTPTVFTVTHSCGHDWSHDLSARPPEQRAGLARWLRLTSCPECNRPVLDPDEQQRRDEEVDEATAAWAETAGMPVLEGPSHRIREATTVRYRLMRAAYQHHVRRGGMGAEQFEVAIETPARSVTSASWWIDRRDTDPADIEELMADLADDPPVPGWSGCGR